MKNNIFRILAYILDLFLVYLIIYLLSFVSILNPNKNKIGLLYEEGNTLNANYIDFTKDIDTYYEDKELSEKEIDSLKSKYNKFIIDVNFSEDINIDNIKEDAKKIYIDDINDIQYRLSKLNRVQDSTLFVVLILYFGLIQYLLNGQTVFKKVFKLKIANLDGTDVPWYKIVGRSLIVNEIIFVMVPIILTVLSKDKWIVANVILEEAKYILEIALIFVLIIREDGRTVHDLIFKTKVISLNDQNKELEVIEIPETTEEDTTKSLEKKDVKKSSRKKVNKKNVKKTNNKDN